MTRHAAGGSAVARSAVARNAVAGNAVAGNAVARSAVARTLSFVPTAIATLLTSRLIIREFGVGSFDSFALILSLIALVPLNNLGVGAAVTSAYAEEGPRSEHSRRVTLTAARVLVVSSLGTAGVALLFSAAGIWPRLLGTASGPNLYCGIAMAVYALSFLPGLGQSMLLGVHRNHVTIVVQTFFTPLILIGTVGVIVLGAGGSYVMVLPSAALLVINVVTSVIAARDTGISWRRLLRELPARRRYPGASIRALSGPMMLITLAVPISLQSDRLVLSHVSTAQAVADYSVVMQIFAPVSALVAASAQPLWPIYTEARNAGRRGPGLGRVLVLFSAATAALCAPLVLVANPIGHLIGGQHIRLGWTLPIIAAAVMLAQAGSYPIAMKLMDPAGVRFVGVCTVLAVPLNVGLSIVLGRHLGAPGPLIASLAVSVALQTAPALLYERARASVGRHRLPKGESRTVFTPSPLFDPMPAWFVVAAQDRQAELATDR